MPERGKIEREKGHDKVSSTINKRTCDKEPEGARELEICKKCFESI
ncbi:hypothetical protein KSD_62390 [Ktedonobacter sp. SOSP1-85]|nr:hypothetical protein KSD_62390 [Ktedonobacter sp. SOSP1-85]